MSIHKPTAFIVVMNFICIATALAQKIPNVQDKSLRAPKNVKVDGIPAEWNGYQAYNHATDVFYTLANDDENLYLTIHVAEANVINKIMGGGILFVIQTSGKKDDKGAVAINYPVYDSKTRPYFRLKYKGEPVPPAGQESTYADSVMNANNKKLHNSNKWILVTGVAGLDTLISVYNEDGVKAAALFDNKKEYTCELCISLKHLKLSADKGAKFSYHIMLNGGANKYTGAKLTLVRYTDASGNTASADQMAIQQEKMDAFMSSLYATTDFWGEYTLAKN